MKKKLKSVEGKYPDAFLDAPLLPTHRITITAKCTPDWADRLVDIIRGLGGVETCQCEELI